MTPVKSTSIKENCSPVSSNCVIWQGPNLPCINLCTGDSVTDVVYKIAEDFCAFKANFDFTDVDLQCILTVCASVPEPQKTLNNILNLIVNKICCMNDIVVALGNAQTPDEIQVRLAQCFNVTNAQGVPLSQLPVSEYVYQMGLKVCEMYEKVYINHENRITFLEGQVNTLVGTPAPTIPQVTPNCILVPGVATDIDAVVDELESQFCTFVDAIGPVTEINKVLAKQCTSLSNLPIQNSLTTGLPINGWVPVPQYLAHSLQNLWLTVCDIRSAVKFIQDNCCKVSCADIIVDFDYKWYTDPVSNAVSLILYFFPKTNVPAGFYDCGDLGATNNGGPGNVFTFTDAAGHTWSPPGIHFRYKEPQMVQGAIMTDQDIIVNGYYIDMTTVNALDINTNLTISSNVCFTDGTNTCIKCVNMDIAAYVDSNATTCCTLTATETVTIVYKTCLQ